LLENFQDIIELRKIIVFQTDDSIDKMAAKLEYSRPHLNRLLNGEGSVSVKKDLIDKIKRVYEKEILQFVRKYSTLGVSKEKARPSVKIETTLTAEQAEAVKFSLNVLDSIFSLGVLKEQANKESVALGKRTFHPSQVKKDKQKDIS
jgi:plasmid maintenance system antidote protein VapI